MQVQLYRRGWSSPGFVPAHLDEGLINIVRCDAVSRAAYEAGVKCVPPEIAQLVKPVTAIQLDTMPRKWLHDAWPSGPVLHAREEGEADGRLQMSRTAVIGGGRSAAFFARALGSRKLRTS